MKLENFHVEIAHWSSQETQDALIGLRQMVFVEEQHVPPERERDGLDGDCWHVLARDAAGAPIGCGRLTPDHLIGRMAVLPEWRGKGVGMAMLRALIERGRLQGWPEVTLHAQADAIGLYQRVGFQAFGDLFEDAGIAHRSMCLTLSPLEPPSIPQRKVDVLPCATRMEMAAARLQLIREARYKLCIYLPLLESGLYDSTDELDELRRVALSGRAASVRIVLHDPDSALRQDHRLIALAQRLPSSIHIRMPVEETDLGYTSSYVINDAGGYLFLPQANQPPGRAARNDAPNAAPLQQHFDQVWHRADRAGMLQTLDI